ncbi:MAG: TetR family transcriptional regulator C-terminal domain-containing protein [Hyphomicrobiales bacterium]|nr:TetR family transcriptional regulator C-terminal domain-containing protein [Hyphomicrobiales bacterium]
MKRNQTKIGEANREKILDAALSLFSRYGLRGTRTDQVAEAAGMSKPNLLYYFRTKQDLYAAVLERTLFMWLDPLAKIAPEADPEAALTTYITAKLDYSRRFPEHSRLFATEILQGATLLEAPLRDDLGPLVAAAVDRFRAWIDEGRLAPIDPMHLMFMIWATTQHYADFAAQIAILTGRSLDDDAFFADVRDTVLHVILNGVKPRPAIA